MSAGAGTGPQVTVVEAEDARRFEARVGGPDGELAGFAAYELDGHAIVFTHTEVDGAYEGRGVGTTLVRGALDALRERGGLRVVPRCPFVKHFVDEHPDYAELLSPPL